jgi:hypothetical protein
VLATFLEPVVETTRQRIATIPDGCGPTAVKHRSDVGIALFADRLLAGNITAFLPLWIEALLRN